MRKLSSKTHLWGRQTLKEDFSELWLLVLPLGFDSHFPSYSFKEIWKEAKELDVQLSV